MKKRWEWIRRDSLYSDYHDKKCDIPEHDDRKLFELLVLEGAQTGFSWLTVLRKRSNYRKAFDDFDARKIDEYIDEYNERKVDGILSNLGYYPDLQYFHL